MTSVGAEESAARILLVEDDAVIREATQLTLERHGYDVSTAMDGLEALETFEKVHPDVVLLDIMLPGLDGISVCRRARETSTVPIVMISARGDALDVVLGLEAGADDYVTKPFAADELLARIRALTRRQTGTNDEPSVTFGEITVDLAAHQVTRSTCNGSATVRLTPTEWAILELLIRNPRRLVTRQSLLTQIWGPQYTTDTGYLRLYLAQLRKKLEPEPSRPRYLLTEPGMGYRFSPDPELREDS